MRKIMLTIEYDGTDFNGWQVQDAFKRTVQGEIENALKRVFKKDIRLIGSGRTDSGVHALAQVAHFSADTDMASAELIRAINASLPRDISIVGAKDVKTDFHAQYNAKSKIYRYTILNRKSPSALMRRHSYFFPYPLNCKMMSRELKTLIGRKDFKSFQATPNADEKEKNTVRAIKRITLKKSGDCITIDFEANGFLHKMIRNIIGTLLEIGAGKIPEGSMGKILAKKNRIFAGKTAKPHGLCLLKVKY